VSASSKSSQQAERAWIAMGSNLGDREAHLRAAVSALAASEGVRVVRASRLYETEPVGPTPQGPYLNAALEIETTLEPRPLLDLLLGIEALEGRTRAERPQWSARSLDLDLLLYAERAIDESGLEVPHPRLHERAFVLEPLAEIAPSWRHPLLGRSIEELAGSLREPSAVRVHPATPLWSSSPPARGD
jgi:2-amino-4-hydroxy-6-hydroxymethyldihydropteridine diphosphokinase